MHTCSASPFARVSPRLLYTGAAPRRLFHLVYVFGHGIGELSAAMATESHDEVIVATRFSAESEVSRGDWWSLPWVFPSTACPSPRFNL